MAHFPDNAGTPVSSRQLANARVVDIAGTPAAITSLQQGDEGMQAWIRLSDGMQVLVPVSLLAVQPDGSYRLPFQFRSASAEAAASEASASSAHQGGQMRFPVMEEELQVDKQLVDTGRGVRLHKTVSEHTEKIEQRLMHDELVVEHVPLGRVVSGEAPQSRYEGNTLVVPVLEEVLVVQKQLVLKEEVRITRKQRPVDAAQEVSLRSEQVRVERFDEGTSKPLTPPAGRPH
ncbi:YsnF/AvaK domain-containing protein [Noviherbaspirillum aerium]|uniref:YsnF/AvaK domain-containing protein n=1 Tax=Noviherbaspirillum aerium TaxID=2588497 RepID=UPI001CEF8552|nr:YsnF/AvaK domain-containing protein [Noviherbaspirillum aerium]